jgi:LPS sulfotransferase NodH
MSVRMSILQALAGLVAPKQLRPAELRRQAELETGLSDPGTRPIDQPLEILCRAASHPAITPVGRIFLKNVLSQRLQARLRIEDYLRRNPSVFRQEIRRPVIIVGLPRTGTTLLHRLLAQDPSARAPLSWEMAHVAPPAAPDNWDRHPARLRSERQSKMRNALLRYSGTPIEHIHETGPNLPEECASLLANYLRSHILAVTLDSPEYLSYMRTPDANLAYETHRFQLQIMQSTFPERRWVLKSPSHLSKLSVLSSLYPDAVFLFTHRDPLEVIPSTTSLVCAGRSAVYRNINRHSLAVEVSDSLAKSLELGLEARAELQRKSGVTIVDVFYPEVKRDPLAVARQIYREMKVPLSEQAENSMKAWFASNRQHKHGKHVYSLEEFGLAEAAEKRRFSAYFDSFGSRLRQAEQSFA